MSRANFFTDNPDISFHLTQRMDFDKFFEWLPKSYREGLEVSSGDEFKEMWLTMLDSVGEAMGSQIAPRSEEVETQDLRLENGEVVMPPAISANIDTVRQLGSLGLTVDPQFGGLGAPFLIGLSFHEMASRSCPSTALNVCWYAIIADVIDEFGTPEQKDEFLPQMAAGEWSGSMALTEADAGSDLARIRTYAEKQDDGTYRIYGSKRFISNGASALSLVLAKSSKGAKGLKSLSLYIVPRKIKGESNFTVSKIEDKLALHGSATCELQFDGSHGQLLGREGEGFWHMLELMNDSRLGVGFQALGTLEAVLRLSKEFAEGRKSWGKPIAQHELIAEKLLAMEVDLKASRSLCYQGAYYRSLVRYGKAYLRENTFSDEERSKIEKEISGYHKLVRKWTPIIKWYVCEKAVEHARWCMQIHGGYGFTKEYKAQWWLRESMILPIYEGTSQMQALMCTKDLLKELIRQPNKFVELALGNKVKTLRESDKLRKKLYKMKQVSNRGVMAVLLKLVKTNVAANFSEVQFRQILKTISRDLVKFENLSPALLHAERLTEMRSLCALGEAVVRDAEQDPERKWIAESFLNRALPRMNFLRDEIESGDAVLTERLNQGDEG